MTDSSENHDDLNCFVSAINAATTPAAFMAAWLDYQVLPDKARYHFDAYYSKFRRSFNNRIYYWYNQQLDDINRLLDNKKVRLLEIGCGTGTESLWFAYRGMDVVGIEISPDYVETARCRQSVLEKAVNRKLDLDFKNISIMDFTDKDCFDIIWIEQAFHHLEPRHEVVRKVFELLKPGGYLAISEANALNILLQIQLFRLRGFRTIIETPGPNGTRLYGNERILPLYTLKRLFENAGIDTVSSRYFRLFPSHRLFNKLLFIEKNINNQLFAPLYTHYNYVGQKPLV